MGTWLYLLLGHTIETLDDLIKYIEIYYTKEKYDPNFKYTYDNSGSDYDYKILKNITGQNEQNKLNFIYNHFKPDGSIGEQNLIYPGRSNDVLFLIVDYAISDSIFGYNMREEAISIVNRITRDDQELIAYYEGFENEYGAPGGPFSNLLKSKK